MNRSYVAPFALGVVLAAGVTGGLLYRRHRMEAVPPVAPSQGPILNQLRALPYVRPPPGGPPPMGALTRMVVIAWHQNCGCTARIDAAVRLIADPAPLSAPLFFVSDDPTPVDVTARLRDQGRVSTRGYWEQHVDVDRHVILAPLAIMGLTALVLDGNGIVISRHGLATDADYEALADAVYTGPRAPGAVTQADLQTQAAQIHCNVGATGRGVGVFKATARATITVARSGAVTVVDARGDEPAASCLESELRKLIFPRHMQASEPLPIEKTFSETIVY